MTRKDAAVILRKKMIEDVTDDIYRSVLRYKAKIVCTGGTYYDIRNALETIWENAPVQYEETPDIPATIHLNFPELSLDDRDPAINRVLAVKAAGVKVLFKSAFLHVNPLYTVNGFIYKDTGLGMWIRSVIYMYTQPDWKFLDGTWPLDGEVLLGGNDKDRVPTRMFLRTKFYTKNHNQSWVPRLNGAWELDGETHFAEDPWELKVGIKTDMKTPNHAQFMINGMLID